MWKSKLNELCQKNRWKSPMYSYIKEGKEHCPLYRGSVVVNGRTFNSQSFFKSSKSAYNDAAQEALDKFTTFTEDIVSTADMPNTKRQKVSTMRSSGSHSDNDVPIKTDEFCPPALEEDKTVITPTDSMNPDSYLLFKKVRVHTSTPTTVLPKGSVVLPIDDNLWIVVSLESN